MRDPEEPLRSRDLNLVAVTQAHPLGPTETGQLCLEGDLPSFPITPTVLEITVALVDGSGRVHDEMAAPLCIGDEPRRAGYQLSVAVQ